MHIALDARELIRPRRRGIGKSLDALWSAILTQRPDWRVTALHRGDPAHWARDTAGLTCTQGPVAERIAWRRLEMPGDRLGLWQQIALPLTAWRIGAAVLHCPANDCPRLSPVPLLACVHDLIPLDFPETVPAAVARGFARGLRRVARSARAIHCPSDYTRSRLLDRLGIAASRVRVTPWGPLGAPPDNDGADRVTADGPFILHLGSGDPRKRTWPLIEAWTTLKPDQRRDARLLIVGLDDREQSEIAACLPIPPRRLGIDLRGYVSDGVLSALTRRALALAYPSSAEGFGMPVLDAMAIGTPVLTRGGTSVAEVGGEAVLAVGSERRASLAEAICRLLSDRSLRERLRSAGRQRSMNFGWMNAAQGVISLCVAINGSNGCRYGNKATDETVTEPLNHPAPNALAAGRLVGGRRDGRSAA